MRLAVWLLVVIAAGLVILWSGMAYWIAPSCVPESFFPLSLTLQQVEPLRTQEQRNRGSQKPKAAETGQRESKPVEVLKAEVQQQKGEAVREGKRWYQYGWWNKFICYLKVGDFFVAFFTYCLVAVGAFAMWSADENTKRGQRAYIVAGTFYGRSRRGQSEKDKRPSASMYEGPWRLTLYNFGTTSGFTVRIDWGICPEMAIRKYIDHGTPVSKIIKDGLLKEYMQAPMTAQHVFAPTGNNPYQIWQCQVPDREPIIGHVLFGRILYKDVFKQLHFSTFSYLIEREHSPGIGTSLSDDHD